MVELEPLFAAAPYWIAAAFFVTHVYGAYVSARVLAAIEGTPHEAHVRELMPALREDMVIVDLTLFPGLKRRPSVFGYHPWNATVWLAIHGNRFTLPDELVDDAHLLRRLRWIEIGLLCLLPALVVLGTLTGVL